MKLFYDSNFNMPFVSIILYHRITPNDLEFKAYLTIQRHRRTIIVNDHFKQIKTKRMTDKIKEMTYF